MKALTEKQESYKTAMLNDIKLYIPWIEKWKKELYEYHDVFSGEITPHEPTDENAKTVKYILNKYSELLKRELTVDNFDELVFWHNRVPTSGWLIGDNYEHVDQRQRLPFKKNTEQYLTDWTPIMKTIKY